MGEVDDVDEQTLRRLAEAEKAGVPHVEVVRKGVLKVIATDPLPDEEQA